MSSAMPNEQDTLPSSAGPARWSAPVLTLIMLAFVTACLGAYGVAGRFGQASPGNDSLRRIVTGSLALLHARMEQQALATFLLAAGNDELRALDEEIEGLKIRLEAAEAQLGVETKKLENVKMLSSNSEIHKEALKQDKAMLEELRRAYDLALTEKKKADQARQTAMGSTTGIPTADDLETWKVEWEALTKDALAKINAAKRSLADLEAKRDAWTQGKNTFTAEVQKEKQSELRTLLPTASIQFDEARAAAAKAKKDLNDSITKHARKLEKAP